MKTKKQMFFSFLVPMNEECALLAKAYLDDIQSQLSAQAREETRIPRLQGVYEFCRVFSDYSTTGLESEVTRSGLQINSIERPTTVEMLSSVIHFLISKLDIEELITVQYAIMGDMDMNNKFGGGVIIIGPNTIECHNTAKWAMEKLGEIRANSTIENPGNLIY